MSFWSSYRYNDFISRGFPLFYRVSRVAFVWVYIYIWFYMDIWYIMIYNIYIYWYIIYIYILIYGKISCFASSYCETFGNYDQSEGAPGEAKAPSRDLGGAFFPWSELWQLWVLDPFGGFKNKRTRFHARLSGQFPKQKWISTIQFWFSMVDLSWVEMTEVIVLILPSLPLSFGSQMFPQQWLDCLSDPTGRRAVGAWKKQHVFDVLCFQWSCWTPMAN